ncbi:NAD-dependent epimerase/dehydratase family protein [candidate division KSB1 bacterium]|nr:NAD-dependent epimerase/dehydratase family protein [candidate division KSB1 bacterium]
MKIFVTGAAGFLGRHLVHLFHTDKHEIVTIARPTSDVKHLAEKNVKIIVGDLRDEKCIAEAAKGVDVIVHAAATLRGSWDDFHAINVAATRALLEQAVKNKVKRFVFISSVIVYDHTNSAVGTRFSEEMPYEEAQQTYYSKTKIEAEQLVNEFHRKKKLATVILRPAAIYGKRGPLFLSRLGFAAGGNRYLIIGNGKLRLPLSYVEGIAEAVKLSVRKKEAVGQTYNVVEEEAVTQNEFFALMRETVKPKFSTVRVPYGFMKFMSQAADKVLGLVGMTSPLPLSYMRLCTVPFSYSNDKIKKELGWQPQKDFRQSLRDMMAWHREKAQPARNYVDAGLKVEIGSGKKLRVGIVGCGVISGPHLDALQRLSNAHVVALCDPVAQARQAMADKYGVAKTYADYKEMLAQEKLDVVHVCTPAQNHAAVSLAAMKHGCHVFVEKPMAATAAEAKRMVSAARRHKVQLCVDHNHVFDKVMIQARRIIASGALGRVSYVESWYGTSYSSDAKSRYLTYEGRSNWAYDMPGLLYQNFISHPISLLLDVMQDAAPKGVQTKFHRIVPHMKSDELRVTFENDEMMGMMHMSMAVSPRYLFVNIYGTGGTLRVDFLNKTVFLDKPNAKLPRVISRSLMSLAQARTLSGAAIRNIFAGLLGKYNMYQGNETLIRLFYKSILDGTPPPISAAEGLRSMEIMDEIWAQMAEKNGQASMPKPRTVSAARNGNARRATKKVAKKVTKKVTK